MTLVWTVAAMGVAYLIGSLSFAVIVSRWMGIADPRSYGSKNPGATNVLRSGNKKAAALTLLLDALKGAVPAFIAAQFGPAWGLGDTAVALVALAAFLGHVWPVFFGFAGGKGVATAAGALLGLNPLLGLATLATWLIIAYFFRYSSLAALVSAVFAPFFHALIWRPSGVTLVIAVMSAMLIWRHSANIGKLIAGTEGRIGQKSERSEKPEQSPKPSKL